MAYTKIVQCCKSQHGIRFCSQIITCTNGLLDYKQSQLFVFAGRGSDFQSSSDEHKGRSSDFQSSSDEHIGRSSDFQSSSDEHIGRSSDFQSSSDEHIGQSSDFHSSSQMST